MTSEERPAATFVADCELGQGLFASRPFAIGETILRFDDPLITLGDAIAKGDLEGNPLQVSPTDYIDLNPPGVYANHSCDPNAGIRDDVRLVALRPILAGEEIRYDYSTTMWEEAGAGGAGAGWTMTCRCGTISCRGLVRDFHLLPAEVQDRYLALGVVQRFIAQRMKGAPTPHLPLGE